MTLIAWFISHHGFVHVARASAALAALQSMVATVQSDIFTHVPSWFFEKSLSGHFRYNLLQTDAGHV